MKKESATSRSLQHERKTRVLSVDSTYCLSERHKTAEKYNLCIERSKSLKMETDHAQSVEAVPLFSYGP